MVIKQSRDTKTELKPNQSNSNSFLVHLSSYKIFIVPQEEIVFATGKH